MTTNAPSVKDFTEQKVYELKEQMKRERKAERKKYLREYQKTDSQKALKEFAQPKIPTSEAQLKQFMLRERARKKLDRLTRRHNDFLDRYYEYRQTDMLDGPAVTLFPKHIVDAAKVARTPNAVQKSTQTQPHLDLNGHQEEEVGDETTLTEDNEDAEDEVPSPRTGMIMDSMKRILMAQAQEKRVTWDPQGESNKNQ